MATQSGGPVVPRRTFLGGLVAGAAGFSLLAGSPAGAQTSSNPVIEENLRTGTAGWQLTKSADDLNKQIKGYASRTSVNVGSRIDFHVSVNRAQRFTIEIYRLGWYQGLGARLVATVASLSGRPRTFTGPDPTTGLIEYDWPASYSLRVPLSWVSGYHLAKLTNADGYQNYIPFVVRNDGRSAALLYQAPVTTDQAYNNFPNVSPGNPGFNPNDPSHIGKSLYDNTSRGAATVAGTARAVKVSFNRPYADDGSGLLLNWDRYLFRWIERMGYDVTYSTNLDTHTDGWRLRRYKAFLSSGHDEYWSATMRDSVEAARDRGVNLAFFGANPAYWQVRFESARNGSANRTMVCYKDAAIDPARRPPAKTILFRDLGRPEQTLVGVQYVTFNGDWGRNTPWVAQNTDHWIYTGTGLQPGDAIPGLVGYEVDGYDPAYPRPASRSATLLSSSTFFDDAGAAFTSNSSIYQAPSGAWVFASGTMSWAWGLDDVGYDVDDARIQQMTGNLLNGFIGVPLGAVAARSVVPAAEPAPAVTEPRPVPPLWPAGAP